MVVPRSKSEYAVKHSPDHGIRRIRSLPRQPYVHIRRHVSQYSAFEVLESSNIPRVREDGVSFRRPRMFELERGNVE